MTTAIASGRLASVLANLAADYLNEANRPIDDKLTKATLDGAAAAAHAAGYGRTPSEVTLTALDYVRAHPRPRAGGAFPIERKLWSEEVDVALATTLHGLLG